VKREFVCTREKLKKFEISLHFVRLIPSLFLLCYEYAKYAYSSLRTVFLACSWSRWPELNRRPTPSFVPCLIGIYKGLDCILGMFLKEFSLLCQSFGRNVATVLALCQAFNRYSGFAIKFLL